MRDFIRGFRGLHFVGPCVTVSAPRGSRALQAKVSQFVALGQLEGRSSRYPRFRWIFPIFYAMTTAGFITLIVYRLITGEAMR
jgi:hypothetical protein